MHAAQAPILLQLCLQLADPGLQLRHRLGLFLDQPNPLQADPQRLPGLLCAPPKSRQIISQFYLDQLLKLSVQTFKIKEPDLNVFLPQ